MEKKFKFKSGYAYSAKHVPTGETWYIIGVDPENDRCCALGWPPTIARITDLVDIQERTLLDEGKLRHRKITFGTNWL